MEDDWFFLQTLSPQQLSLTHPASHGLVQGWWAVILVTIPWWISRFHCNTVDVHCERFAIPTAEPCSAKTGPWQGYYHWSLWRGKRGYIKVGNGVFLKVSVVVRHFLFQINYTVHAELDWKQGCVKVQRSWLVNPLHGPNRNGELSATNKHVGWRRPGNFPKTKNIQKLL